MSNDSKVYVSYNQIKDTVERYRINEEFKPDLMIAIGGGGFIPARILRTFLKRQNNKNIPIQAIGLSLYEELFVSTESEQAKNDSALAKLGNQVIKTQWLQFGPPVVTTLLGKNILIVDEVDDTRTTLAYAIQELTKDIDELKKKFILEYPGKDVPATRLAVFVLHNKIKEKRMEIPDESIVNGGRYWAAKEVPDRWIVYPWESTDIEEHTEKSLISN
ncbi:9690_t:CDS:2 [Ambispora gerdemannii]|uniref:9690_t:CDS:1 n=1 Tax=Ambispora gerdemannii TaxID=144530 RepID=A0A9N8VB82_9GLOM|nr:9690_t:CDS:2 [Ambispora gerdemannii]